MFEADFIILQQPRADSPEEAPTAGLVFAMAFESVRNPSPRCEKGELSPANGP
jgi:hypothetical protein